MTPYEQLALIIAEQKAEIAKLSREGVGCAQKYQEAMDEIDRLQEDLKDARYQIGVWEDKANRRADEIDRLRHDIERHICGDLATENEKLRAALEEILPIADGPARPLNGLHIATIVRKALAKEGK